MARMTAEQVAQEFDSRSYDWEPAEAVALVRDNLVPQWQAEPDGCGLYWVKPRQDGEDSRLRFTEPIAITRGVTEEWECSDWDANEFDLDGRQVCSISPPPKGN